MIVKCCGQVVQNGNLVDGAVLVINSATGRITHIGPDVSHLGPFETEIAAWGMVCLGFVDIHNHGIGGSSPYLLLRDCVI